jgi:hypothetical protein
LEFPTGWSLTTQQATAFSGAVAGEEWKTSAREVFARTSFTLLVFCFTLFILPALFYMKKPKKLESLIVAFIFLFLVFAR